MAAPSVNTVEPAPLVASAPATTWHVFFVASYLVGLAIALFSGLVALWSLSATQASPVVVPLIGAREISPEVRLLLLAALCGGLGSFLHAATSFAGYVGNQRIVASWLCWYYFRPLIGSALAVVVYFVMRAGLIGPAATTSDVNAYGIAAMAALAGMFSKQATDKLDEVFTAVFNVSKKGGDAQRSHKLNDHAPLVISVSPSSLSVGMTSPQVQVSGDRLLQESVVRVNDSPRPSKLVDGRITATLSDGDVKQPGTLTVTVTNPDGAVSPPVKVAVK